MVLAIWKRCIRSKLVISIAICRNSFGEFKTLLIFKCDRYRCPCFCMPFDSRCIVIGNRHTGSGIYCSGIYRSGTYSGTDELNIVCVIIIVFVIIYAHHQTLRSIAIFRGRIITAAAAGSCCDRTCSKYAKDDGKPVGLTFGDKRIFSKAVVGCRRICPLRNVVVVLAVFRDSDQVAIMLKILFDNDICCFISLTLFFADFYFEVFAIPDDIDFIRSYPFCKIFQLIGLV